MTAKQLFAAGKLTEAVQALNGEVRDNPLDAQRRTFLFELLCFTGDYDRAEKQLHMLAKDGGQKELGAVLYFSALHAQRMRESMFEKGELPSSGQEPTAELAGKLNGQPFKLISDSDPRIGPRLEVFGAGSYMWIPYEHIEYLELQAPKRVRDLLWIPALVRTGPAFKGTELGEVLLPVLTPLSCKNPNDQVRLGRTTEYQESADGEILPAGQKTLLFDEEEIPLLEVRTIEFAAADSAAT
jgi:type VI secretion system protein ImpE